MSAKGQGIYVEVLIRADMDELWRHTQDPSLHQCWDLRFSRIEYLPRDSEAVPQHFLYATRIGLGWEIAGEGESLGSRDLPGGERASALKFSSNHPLSLIREGSGYWKYIPGIEGIRFLTWYDYQARFGSVGRILDRVLFRPLLGWATAWSFDCLRLWLEKGIHPTSSRRQALVHAASRLALAVVFAYHGLVPKLLYAHADEVRLLADAGLGKEQIPAALAGLGIAELLFAFCLLLFWRSVWPLGVCLVFMLLATIAVAFHSPRVLTAAFNPVSLNLCVGVLALVSALCLRDLPSAGHCKRKDPGGGP